MALFGRDQLPHRSTLSRFLAALDQPTVEALRARFQEDLFARNPFASPGGVFDRRGVPWLVIDVDGTRQTARQRALPQTEALPAPHRRFDQTCAPGYQGRKRGEVVRTRTVVLQAHTHQFLGTFSLKVGVERDGMVYELFLSTLPSPAFTSSDVLDLYLHRGSFETALADEDGEQDSDRWCSRTPHGQEFWQIMNQWVWNLRLELGQKLSPSELHITEFAAAGTVEPAQACDSSTLSKPTPAVTYGPPQWARPSFTHGFPGSAFTPQPDGTLRCPADRLLYPQERRPERDGSIRVLYAARIGHCRSCPLRTQCQESSSTVKPRRVSAVLWPLIPSLSDASPPLEDTSEALPLAPVLWKDWPRCRIRRAWLKIIRRETVQLMSGATSTPIATETPKVFTRTQRAHWRLSWEQRLARNARPSDDSPLIVTLHGLSAAFACCLGFDLLATA
jgi:hypothetical protein